MIEPFDIKPFPSSYPYESFCLRCHGGGPRPAHDPVKMDYVMTSSGSCDGSVAPTYVWRCPVCCAEVKDHEISTAPWTVKPLEEPQAPIIKPLYPESWDGYLSKHPNVSAAVIACFGRVEADELHPVADYSSAINEIAEYLRANLDGIQASEFVVLREIRNALASKLVPRTTAATPPAPAQPDRFTVSVVMEPATDLTAWREFYLYGSINKERVIVVTVSKQWPREVTTAVQMLRVGLIAMNDSDKLIDYMRAHARCVHEVSVATQRLIERLKNEPSR